MPCLGVAYSPVRANYAVVVIPFIQALSYPTSTFENAYLQLGSYNLWDLWQIAGDVTTPLGKCDISVSRLPLAQFNALFNLTTPPPPPVDPGQDDDTNTDTGDLAAQVKANTAAIAEILTRLDKHIAK